MLKVELSLTSTSTPPFITTPIVPTLPSTLLKKNLLHLNQIFNLAHLVYGYSWRIASDNRQTTGRPFSLADSLSSCSFRRRGPSSLHFRCKKTPNFIWRPLPPRRSHATFSMCRGRSWKQSQSVRAPWQVVIAVVIIVVDFEILECFLFFADVPYEQ